MTESQVYDLGVVRKLLDAALDEEELSGLAFDRFPAAAERFQAGMSKRDKLRRLVSHCRQQGQIGTLLARVRRLRPRQYRRFQDRLVTAAPEEEFPEGLDVAEREHLRALLEEKRSRLQVLELQRAHFGDAHCPPHILLEIKDLQREVARISDHVSGISDRENPDH